MGVSIGMVGLGKFGTGFVNLFKAHPLVERIAFCDIEEDRVKKFAESAFMKEKFNPNDAYTSLDDICKSDLDAIVLITQPWLHAPQVVRVLESGKAAFCAVPIFCVPDGDEILGWCDEIIDTVRNTGKQFMLGETTYYHPEVMFMRRQAVDGAFGRFISANAEYAHDYSGAWGRSMEDVYSKRIASVIGSRWPRILKEKYIDKGILSGPMHYPTHSVSGPVSIMKSHASKVSAIGMKPTGLDDMFDKWGEVFSNETGVFYMNNGAVFTAREYREITTEGYKINIFGTCATWREETWYWTRREPGLPRVPDKGEQKPTLREMCDDLPREVAEAYLLAENPARTAEEIKDVIDAEGPIAYPPVGHGGSNRRLVHEFVSSLAENRAPAINAWEACHYMAMGVMAHKSALRDGELLAVPDWGEAPVSL